MFLDHKELIELTGKRYRDAQLKQLRSMGIQHKIRGDGRPVVLKSHVEKILGGGIITQKEGFTLHTDRI